MGNELIASGLEIVNIFISNIVKRIFGTMVEDVHLLAMIMRSNFHSVISVVDIFPTEITVNTERVTNSSKVLALRVI